MSQTGYADVLLGFFVYRHNFFGGMLVAQNIPVIINDRHGSNVTYNFLFTPLALRILTSRLTTCIICYYFIIACPEHISLPVFVAICIRCFLFSQSYYIMFLNICIIYEVMYFHLILINILLKEMFEDIKVLIRSRKWKNLFIFN